MVNKLILTLRSQLSYHIKKDDWVLEVGIFLGICDDSGLYNMTSKIDVHLRSIHCGQIYPFHFTDAPEQSLRNKERCSSYARIITLFVCSVTKLVGRSVNQ